MNTTSLKRMIKTNSICFHPFAKKILKLYYLLRIKFYCYHKLNNKRRYYLHTHKQYKNNLRILNNKLSSKDEKIRCVYFALFNSIWKCDGMYQLMEENPHFEPIVLVCPIVNNGKDNMLQRMEECYNQMKKKGYKVVKSYNKEMNAYINVKDDLNPDIIVYTNPYKGLIDDRYYITNFENVLTIYIPYFFGNNIDYNTFNNQYLHNIVWRLYCETQTHKEYYQRYQDYKGRNVVCTGYPGIDGFLKESHFNTKLSHLKTIIWAPHHTVNSNNTVNFSCFLKYYDFMVKTAEKYQDKVHFVFKPHPLLINKLYKLWGKEKTDSYYHLWDSMPNTSLNDGEYVDLFLTSDAMIHDSGSFITEYLYTHKPVMRTMNDIDPKTMYNDFALDVLGVYYKGYREEDIEIFIQNVINGIDPMKEKREKFYKERLLPPNGKLPSQNILDDIIESINKNRL